MTFLNMYWSKNRSRNRFRVRLHEVVHNLPSCFTSSISSTTCNYKCKTNSLCQIVFNIMVLVLVLLAARNAKRIHFAKSFSISWYQFQFYLQLEMQNEITLPNRFLFHGTSSISSSTFNYKCKTISLCQIEFYLMVIVIFATGSSTSYLMNSNTNSS